MDHPIKIAIKGALTSFQGFGDFIASTNDFSADPETVKAIDALDQELCSFYEEYPDNFESHEQLFCLTRQLGAQRCVVLIRARKRFTQFPDRSRFYDRREYYMLPAGETLDKAAFVNSLPAMRQFPEKQLGSLPTFTIDDYKAKSPHEDFIKFIRHFRNRETLLLNTTEAPLDFVHQLPEVYRQHLSFALNIRTKDPWVTTYLHLITTPESLPPAAAHEKEALFEEFCKKLLRGKLDYGDEELTTTQPEKSKLWDLVNYHWLHFAIDSGEHAPGLEDKSRDYVDKFATTAYAQNGFIAGRIKAIYLYWNSHTELDTDTFFAFWQQCRTAGGLIGRLQEDPGVRKATAAFVNKLLDAQRIRDSQTLQQQVDLYKQVRNQKLTALPTVDAYFDALEDLLARAGNKAELTPLVEILIRENGFFSECPIQKPLSKELADPGWKEACSLDKMQALINAYPHLKDIGFIRQVLESYDLLPLASANAAGQLMEITDFLVALLPAENPRIIEDYGRLLAGGLEAMSPAEQRVVIGHLLTVAPEKGNALLLQSDLWPDELIQASWQASTSSKNLPSKMKNIIEFTNKWALLTVVVLAVLLIGSLWWHWSDANSAAADRIQLDSLQARIQYYDSSLRTSDTANARLRKELDSLRHKTAELPAIKDSVASPHRPGRTRRSSEVQPRPAARH